MEAWNELMNKYKEYTATTEWALGYSVVDELLGDVGGKEILDYGCGTGKYTRHLARRGAIVRAGDSSADAIEIAASQHVNKGSYFGIKPDDPSLSFLPDNTLDGAVANFLFCCIPRSETISQIMRTIRPRLKPGAPFVICDNHPWSVGSDFVSFSTKPLEERASGNPIDMFLKGPNIKVTDYWHSLEEYFTLLKGAGFDIESIREPMTQDRPDLKIGWLDEVSRPPFIIIKAMKGGEEDD